VAQPFSVKFHDILYRVLSGDPLHVRTGEGPSARRWESSIDGEVKRKHSRDGRTFSCFQPPVIEPGCF
jgi:hypothetical protein